MQSMGYFEPNFHPHHQYQQEHLSTHYTDGVHPYTMSSHTNSMMAMSNPPKANETKPRLAKEEVDILEREFQKNPKPTTQTKRQFAEDMGVDLARINNWFQNRRAKRKQEKKQEAYEAGQAQEAATYSEPSSPDGYVNVSSYFEDSQLVPTPRAKFPASGPPPPVASYNPQYDDPTSASIESLQRTLAAAQAGSVSEADFEFVDKHHSLSTFEISHLQDFSDSDRAQFPASDQTFIPLDQSQSYSYPVAFTTDLYSTDPSVSEVHSSPEQSHHQTPTSYNSYPSTSGGDVTILQPITTTFPSQLLPIQCNDGLPALTADSGCSSQSPEESHLPAFDLQLPVETVSSPPDPSIPFRSPPPMDIASRRKKVQHKPAALSAMTISSRPPMGPRTVSHAESFRRPSDSPGSSPMRRVISAGGSSSSRSVISGRIQKTGVESAQRSPINLGGFESAGSFIERNLNAFRKPPSLTGASSLSSSLAPPTPMSPRERQMTLVKREVERPHHFTASPEESNVNFVFNAGVPGCFTTVEGDLASPPKTPHAHLPLQQPFNGWVDSAEYNERQWQFEVPDEPLYTPGLQETFHMELQMPQPTYLSSLSQPVTPAFGPSFNSGFVFGHESPQFNIHNGPEYAFPETNPFSLGMSPNMTKPKTFQFSHTTPADYSEK